MVDLLLLLERAPRPRPLRGPRPSSSAFLILPLDLILFEVLITQFLAVELHGSDEEGAPSSSLSFPMPTSSAPLVILIPNLILFLVEPLDMSSFGTRTSFR